LVAGIVITDEPTTGLDTGTGTGTGTDVERHRGCSLIQPLGS
jgi:hypothetical protein